MVDAINTGKLCRAACVGTNDNTTILQILQILQRNITRHWSGLERQEVDKELEHTTISLNKSRRLEVRGLCDWKRK